jgi:lactobin A/cerein 7B family class IIb bacteriocin
MRELTTIELESIHGGVDGWRSAFDVAIGGLSGAMAGCVIGGLTATGPDGLLGVIWILSGGVAANMLSGAVIGIGVGLAAGALFAVGRELMS